MNLYSYIVVYDGGFAPNPFFDYCSLAVCKPVIRRTSGIGDWIFGLSPKKQGYKLIYAMKISEKLSFCDYFNDQRFDYKKPKFDSKNIEDCVGDNFYRLANNGQYKKLISLHDVNHKDKDLRGIYVLISDKEDFYYFGSKPVTLPYRLISEISVERNFKKLTSEKNKETIDALLKFIKQKRKGINSYPTLWPPKSTIHKLKCNCDIKKV